MAYGEYSVSDLGYDSFLSRGQVSDSTQTLSAAASGSSGTMSYSGGLADINNTFNAPAQTVSGNFGQNLTLVTGLANVAHISVGDSSYLAGLNAANASGDIAFWAGSTYDNRATAPFRVTAAGALTATSATISGSLTVSGGTIGGFDIGSDYIRDSANSMGLASTVTGGDDVRFWAGAAYASRSTAPFRVTEAGAVTMTSATVNGSTVSNQNEYGDGSDGSATISSPTTLTRDMYYTTLTVNTGVTLTTGGYRVFVNGTLTLTGTGKIDYSGNAGGNAGNGGDGSIAGGGSAGTAGTAGAAASALADGSLTGGLGGLAGVIGAVGSNAPRGTGGDIAGHASSNGSNGTDRVKSLASGNAVNGSRGGNTQGNDKTSGTAGTGGSKTGTVFNSPHLATSAYLMYDFLPAGDTLRSAPSPGSSTGGAGGRVVGNGNDGAASGGGGGGGGCGGSGGIVVVFARVLAGTGTISANGGAGGNGGAAGNGDIINAAGGNRNACNANTRAYGSGGGGGGAGGGGGVVILVYSQNTGSVTTSATGGAGGSAGAAGLGYLAGNPPTAYDGVAGTAGTSGPAGLTVTMQI